MNLAAFKTETTEDFYRRLMAARQGYAFDRNIEDTLARILSSWTKGEGNMPDWLGLGEEGFFLMLQRHFPFLDSSEFINPGRPLDLSRMDEVEDLRQLLNQSRTGHLQSERWMVDIVIAGCLGSDHLWQDLGLWERPDLSKLMMQNFASLAKRNDKDMKWKKFLYKQLCEAEGIYTCRSPSCEVCVDYEQCFNSED